MSFDVPHSLPEDGEGSASLHVLALALDERDRYTDTHCQRVARIALALGQRCELSTERLSHLSLAARFHDVGKIGIRDNVLLHPGHLGEEQMESMRTHPDRGARLFAASGRRDAAAVARLIRHHHEAYDGSGYPAGLKGREIPLEARILTIADGYDAMTSKRPYRGPMPHSRAMRILADGQEGLIDPDVFREFTCIIKASALLEA
ncbi:HD domain-containing phosphohydrolase [Stenotrophomonas sp. YIM B06876]|uniref:HD-GYP domain-containing protein n=1 Tax=Stenotrophomonas sp. YIM B06876 TaxID=3060211 RepID=UPI0027381F95|nr:HD domain-containing phosphohydrolase [Stenotrophomonas sp. YIM B06876]